MKDAKKYEFRELNATDIFPMVHIISQIGIKEFKECFSTDEVKKAIFDMKDAKKKDDAIKTIGLSVVFDIVDLIVKSLPKCENDIFNLLASVSGMKRKDVEKMPMGDFIEMLVDFIKKPEFADFISVVSRFVK